MLEEIRKRLQNEKISVTDIPKDPTDNRTGYDYTEDNPRAERDAMNATAKAAAGKTGVKADTLPIFWQTLANYVAISRIAKCPGCTAYAARCLEGLAKENKKTLLICGIPDSDHHVLLVTDQVRGYGTIFQGGADEIVVDLWQYNLGNQTGSGQMPEMLANYANQHYYTQGADIKAFVPFN